MSKPSSCSITLNAKLCKIGITIVSYSWLHAGFIALTCIRLYFIQYYSVRKERFFSMEKRSTVLLQHDRNEVECLLNFIIEV